MEQHNKIINSVARKILKPHEIFQKGSSRTWFDDKDYYIIVVEFQPSAYSKGSFLNVGVNFLWKKTKGLNEILSYDYGGRVHLDGMQFASYNSVDKFEREMINYANIALEKVMEYRQFRDLGYAKTMLIQAIERNSKNQRFWDFYDLSMLCFLKGDFDEGKSYFQSYMDILKDRFYVGDLYIEWHEEFYDYCQKEICPQLNSKEKAQRMVFDMINCRRAFFNSKTAYKKMKKDVVF